MAEKYYPPNALLGKPVADEIISDVLSRSVALSDLGWHAHLVSLVIGDASAADLYVRNQRRVADRCGISFEERVFPSEVSMSEMLGVLASLNTDPRVTGIILQRPVPVHLNVRVLQSSIHPFKDVEGMHPSSIGNIVYKDIALAPCTASASVELLRRTGLDLEGLYAVVIGHSEIVGKPIAFLLMSEGSTVTVCHHMTRNLSVHSRQADAVFVATGKPRLITGDMIKPGCVLIDIGINRVVGDGGIIETVGDIDFVSCSEVAGWVTPVPGGVGPVTVSVLMRNALLAVEVQKRHYDSEFGLSGDRIGVSVPPLE